MVGEIDYPLTRVQGQGPDPDYSEGPENENGCYLLTITDAPPAGHYTNEWWHQHRKVVIDVDNNVWGSGMPNPVFMVYFNENNALVSLDGEDNRWKQAWKKGVTYDPKAWYRVEIERTRTEFTLRVLDEHGALLKEGSVPHELVWHANASYPDYLALGDPHENYYEGSMKIKSIVIQAA